MKKSMSRRLFLVVCTLVLCLAMVSFASVTAEAKSKVKLNKTRVVVTKNSKEKWPKVTLKLNGAPSPAVKWSVSNGGGNCRVSKKGVVQISGSGEFLVTAKYSGRKYHCRIHALSTYANINVGTVVVGGSNTYYNVPVYGVTTASEMNKVKIGNTNPNVCDVERSSSSGIINLVVKPKRKGTARITATYRGKTVYCKVTIKNEVEKKPTTNAVSDLEDTGLGGFNWGLDWWGNGSKDDPLAITISG